VAGTVTTYVQPITEPLQGLHTGFTNLASQHREINKQLRSHADDLLSGSGFTFQGAGAQAFSGLVNYYVDTSEKHMQAFDGAAGAVRTCHSTITTASANADGAGLHPGLTNHVLSQVSHNDIIERGSEPVWSVVNDLIGTLGDLAHQETSFWGNVFTFHFGSALDDLVQAGKDIKQIASDATSLLQDIGRVLGSWAETVWSAIKTVGSFLGSVLWNVADFVLGISSIINDVKVLFDPHKSIWEKLLAAGDLALNVGMDLSMVLGIGEGLKAGELLIKGGIDLGEKLVEDGGEKVVEELGEKGAEDVTEAFSKSAGEEASQLSADLYGPAIENNPEELANMVSDVQKSGGNVIFTEDVPPGQGGYLPESTPGKPGVIKVNPETDISTFSHEYQHFVDDRDLGYPGMGYYFQNPEVRIDMEGKAYDLEIGMAQQRGYNTLADLLQQAKDETINGIKDRFGL
jgi:hypothetical protein